MFYVDNEGHGVKDNVDILICVVGRMMVLLRETGNKAESVLREDDKVHIGTLVQCLIW